MIGPTPLPIKTTLNRQFLIESVLGQGGFGITYCALDSTTGKKVVLKEMAPIGASRLPDGGLTFEQMGQAAVHRLRIQFAQEINLLSKIRPMGAVTCLSTFVANQTVYAVMPYLEGAKTLDDILKRGLLEPAGVEEIVVQLLHSLENIHANGVLHLDIKPSNILILQNESVRLIDFGSAREWIASQSGQYTIQFSPGFAPLEQLSDQTRRGPGTDLYSLAATAWRCITDVPLVDAVARLQGVELPDLEEIVPGINPDFAHAIVAALAIKLDERPSSARDMLFLIDQNSADSESLDDFRELDKRLVQLRKLRIKGKECPSCNGVLVIARPAKERQCWVCNSGTITPRRLNEKTCAACKVGVLKLIENKSPLAFCPKCRTGRLAAGGIKMPWAKSELTCQSCGAQFAETKTGVSIVGTDEETSWYELREFSERSEQVLGCDVCDAQFDVLEDGRWKIEKPAKGVSGYTELYPDEWARLAKGFEPGSGNSECSRCQADYHLDAYKVALLNLPSNIEPLPNHHLGKLLNLEQARWLAGGKSSGELGLVCDRCHLEFDFDEDEQSLILVFPGEENSIKTQRLQKFIGASYVHLNWHRVAFGLPFVGDENLLEDALNEAIVDAFIRGEFKAKLDWQCPAKDDRGRALNLRADEIGIHYGGRLRKAVLPWGDILDIRALAGESLEVRLRNGQSTIFQLEPTFVEAVLASGNRRLTLFADDIAARCKYILKG